MAPCTSVGNAELRGISGDTTERRQIGADRDLTFRLVVVDSASYVQEPTWLVTGWDLLCKAAPYEGELFVSVTDEQRQGL